MDIKNMTLEEKFAQMLLIGLDVSSINDEIIALIKQYKIGGVVLYKSLYTSSNELIDVVNKLKEININNIPLFIAIDQENGRVNRFPKDFKRIYNARKQAETNNLELIDECNIITSKLLNLYGINMNFAPVLDICRNDKNKVIGNRSYGNNKEDIIKYGIPFMKTMQDNNIISVIKHFPGHGLTTKDSHIFIPKIKDVSKMVNEDLKVFESAIDSGCDAIMVGHLLVSGYGSLPASINKKFLNDYLPKKYEGLIITDDLKMNVLKYVYGVNNSIKLAVEAGNDLLIIKYENNDINKVYKRLFNKVKIGFIGENRINASAEKIIKYKEKYELNNDLINNDINKENINQEIKLVNEKMDLI